MKAFELFTMIYYVLDAYWDDHKSEELGQFLSGMNPFLFKGEGSAIPYIYTEFCDFLNGREIKIENSFELATEYIDELAEPYIREAFKWISKEKWLESCKDYVLGNS